MNDSDVTGANPASSAPSPSSTPEQAFAALLEGNRRFVDGDALHPHQDEARRRLLETGQAPYATVLGCSDSRVPVELLFDQGFGDVFVSRNAGHVLGRSMQASVEFAVAVLGVRVVLVLGHESCGAVGATVEAIKEGTQLPGEMPILVEHVRDHLDPEDPAARAVEAHVLGTLDELRERSSIVREAEERGEIVLAGAVYGLTGGAVRVVSGPEV
ncbi:carbonic anhydrase [Brachybacterium halotolerans subsp. kimchii]|uniref:carbonic anhydrase n=1 Tax=Brachybacterium halotolerans TaxID=2795215 RepID=UPI001E4FDB3B|nr:carbonic anhydrase [Brachybacterium halotolerans]UEJ82280.1 carbonic anhydrase [Brachybacterium halotolerans subsp. kimchii]